MPRSANAIGASMPETRYRRLELARTIMQYRAPYHAIAGLENEHNVTEFPPKMVPGGAIRAFRDTTGSPAGSCIP